MPISNCNGRAIITDILSYNRCFDFVKEAITKIVLEKEFESKLDYPITTGYIEFVSVKKILEEKEVLPHY